MNSRSSLSNMATEDHVRDPRESMRDAMLACLHPAVPNDDATLIYALRWQGFTLAEIGEHLSDIKRRRA